MIRKLFRWIFKNELSKLESQVTTMNYLIEKCNGHEKMLRNILGNIDVSVDVHEYSPSWAVISLQGEKTDYIKFIEMGNSDIRQIQEFLRRFERNANIKVDASPKASQFLKIERWK